jgi:hypothetical protein
MTVNIPTAEQTGLVTTSVPAGAMTVLKGDIIGFQYGVAGNKLQIPWSNCKAG